MELSPKKRELIIKWIVDELDEGRQPHTLKDAMLAQGIEVDYIIYLSFYLPDQYFYPMRDALLHDKETTDASISRTVRRLLSLGLNKGQIIEYTNRMGYTEDAIVKTINSQKVKGFVNNLMTGASIMLSFGALFFFLIWWALANHNNPAVIIVGFFPSLVTLALVIIFIEHFHSKHARLLWFVPVIVTGLFYLIGSSSTHPVFEVMPVNEYAGINFLFSATLIAVLFAIGAMGKETNMIIAQLTSKHVKKKSKVKVFRSLREKTQELLGELEALAEMINTASDEVYSKTNCATPKMKEKVLIDFAVFEMMEEIMAHDPNRNPKGFTSNLVHLKDAFRTLAKPEKELFEENLYKLKINCRNEDGTDRVIDVLENNTKKDVKSAYSQALQILFELFRNYRELLHKQRLKEDG